MPNYDYECGGCGSFTLLRRIAERAAPAPCPHCGVVAKRVLRVPQFALLDRGLRGAMETNERSRHAPKVRTAHQCGSGCGCSPGQKLKPERFLERRIETRWPSAFQTGSQGSRPWMLGH